MGIFEEKAYKGVLRSENSDSAIFSHSRYPFRSVICKIQIIIDKFPRQGIFPKIFFPVSTNCAILGYEMNDMQNRILCVKCSVNGELSLKRKVRLTVYYPHPLQTI